MQEPDPLASVTPGPGHDNGAAPTTGLRSSVAHAGRGALMGLADLIPGISGGTVALILGIHPRLVAAIAAFDARLPRDLWGALRGDPARRVALRRLDLPLLLPLGLGIATAILIGARFVHHALESWAQYAMALFFGLLLASIPLPWRHIQRKVGGTWLLAGVGFLVAASLSFLPGGGLPITAVALLAAGTIALTAMLLPGVSGSALLVLLGVYTTVVGAVSELDLRVLIPFGSGAVLGLMASSRALKWLYVHAWDGTLALMTGLIAGSLVRVWPWRSASGFAEGVPVGPEWSIETVVLVVVMVAAFTIVLVVDRLAGRSHREK